MPPELADFPDPIIVLRELLGDLADCGTAAPADDWDGDPAFLRIRIFGGTDDRQTDFVRFDIDALVNDEQAAYALAGRARQRLLATPHVLTSGVLDNATTDTRPHQVPWGASTSVFNATATYTASVRRRAAA